MNAQATRRGVPAVALWGGLGVLAWAAITAFTGGGSAQADEQNDPSLLDGVSSLVSGTISSVGDTVTAVTEPVVTQVVAPVVTQVVEPVVTQVVAPVPQAAPPVVETVTDTVADIPVVGSAVIPVVETVTDTAEAVVTPVTDLLQNAPGSQIVDPIRDAVTALPLVGDLLQDLGVIGLVDDVVGAADGATGLVGGVVENTVPPVLTALDPTVSLAPETVPDRGFDSVLFSPASRDLRATTAPSSLPAPAGGSTSAPAAVQPEAAPATPAGAPAAPAGPPAPSSSAASGGASASSPARVSDAGIFALRAVERTSGASDDVLPTSLVADTDVSPD